MGYGYEYPAAIIITDTAAHKAASLVQTLEKPKPKSKPKKVKLNGDNS